MEDHMKKIRADQAKKMEKTTTKEEPIIDVHSIIAEEQKTKKQKMDIEVALIQKKPKKETPLSKSIQQALEFLSKNRKEFTEKSLLEELKIEKGQGSALIDQLKKHTKISHKQVGNLVFFEYNPKYKVRNSTGILELLESNPDGLIFDDVKDAYDTAEEDLKVLEEQGKIYVIVWNTKKQIVKIIFAGLPAELTLAIDPDLKQKWLGITMVRREDLEYQIEAFKDKNTKPLKIINRTFRSEKKSDDKDKKKRKLTKETNSHLKGQFDFSEIWKSPYGPNKK
jgi:hypothetical protein